MTVVTNDLLSSSLVSALGWLQNTSQQSCSLARNSAHLSIAGAGTVPGCREWRAPVCSAAL